MKRLLPLFIFAAAMVVPSAALANSIQPIVPQPVSEPLPCPEAEIQGDQMVAPSNAPDWCTYVMEAMTMEQMQRATETDAATGIVISGGALEVARPIMPMHGHHHGSTAEWPLLALLSGLLGYLLGRDRDRQVVISTQTKRGAKRKR